MSADRVITAARAAADALQAAGVQYRVEVVWGDGDRLTIRSNDFEPRRDSDVDA